MTDFVVDIPMETSPSNNPADPDPHPTTGIELGDRNPTRIAFPIPETRNFSSTEEGESA